MTEATRAIEFGIFDWIDFSRPEELAGRYEQRLRILEYADAAGFYCYHLAEHHLTLLGGAPSPAVFLAAATQRTSRIRLGSLVFVLPLYNPVRLVQEICMLDHLSNGRLEIGWGRGASPIELQLLGTAPEDARERDAEAFELLIQALSTGRIERFEGKQHRYGPLELAVRPLQQPYPPLWHPVSGVERAAWLGQHGINTVMHGEDYSAARDRLEAYAESWQTNRESPNRLNAHVPSPRFGLLKQVYLAEDHDQAVREAKRAYELHGRAFLYLWDFFGESERWAPMKDFEGQMRSGGLLVGTPAEVGERLAEQLDATGANYIMTNFSFGDLTDDQVVRSIGLFAKEIIPRIKASAGTFRP